MNKAYLIAPLVLMGLFGFLYNGALNDMKAKAEARHQAALVEEAKEAERKAAIDAEAKAEAIKRQEEREAADLAKAEKRERDYQDAMKQLNDETADYNTQSAALAKESAALETQISQALTDKERLNLEVLNLTKEVELAKINRRTAELEIQRLMEMVATKLSDSPIATPPPPPLLPVTK